MAYEFQMAQVEALRAAAEANAPDDTVRTITDLLKEAGLEDSGVAMRGVTLSDLAAAAAPPKMSKANSGRAALLAKLKEAGVDKLSDRQKLANALGHAKREMRLKPSKSEVAAEAGDGAAPSGASGGVDEPPMRDATRGEGRGASASPAVGEDAEANGVARKKEVEQEAASGAAGEAELPPGTRVRVDGLKARPELNGAGGTVLSFDAGRGRYNVEVGACDGGTAGGGGIVALKRQNLNLS